MSAKTGGQGRRTPLSLTSGIPKLQSQNHQTKSQINANGNAKTEQKNQQKGEQVVNDGKDVSQQQQKTKKDKNPDNADVSKNQNDKKSENGNNNKPTSDKQEQQQNGTDKKGTNKDMKEKADKNDNKKQESKAVAKEKEAKDKTADTKEKGTEIRAKDNDQNEKKEKVNDKKSNVEKSAAKVVQQGDNETKVLTTTATKNNEEDVAMDISTNEEVAKPATVTPKRPVREKKTVTPTKPADKLAGSPSIVISRAEKAAANAAASASTATTSVTIEAYPTIADNGTGVTITNTTAANSNTTPTKCEKNEKDNKHDEDMETITLDPSPIKSTVNEKLSAGPFSESNIINPTATSTPGKPNQKYAGLAMKRDVEPLIGDTPDCNTYARSYTQINGRRSIRPINEYTPSKFQSNLQFRESYRRINTELDVSSTTNTSMNVTVGSEIPNNSSFSSFFTRGRKRDRAPSNLSLAADVQSEIVKSPPKRARLEGLFNIVASPITMLRAHFSKTSIQNSAPLKVKKNLACDEEIDNVQNLSGGDENMPPAATENINSAAVAAANIDADLQVEETTASEHDITVGQETDADPNKLGTSMKTIDAAVNDNNPVEQCDNVDTNNDAAPIVDDIDNDDIEIVVTPIAGNAAKEKQSNGCVLM